jgi:hypothetical protein
MQAAYLLRHMANGAHPAARGEPRSARADARSAGAMPGMRRGSRGVKARKKLRGRLMASRGNPENALVCLRGSGGVRKPVLRTQGVSCTCEPLLNSALSENSCLQAHPAPLTHLL